MCELVCGSSHIATNLSIDPELLDRALEVSGERTKKAAVTKALREFIARREQLRNVCRRSGVQVGTIDALLAQLCIRHELTMLTTDADFTHKEARCGLRGPLAAWTRPSSVQGCIHSES